MFLQRWSRQKATQFLRNGTRATKRHKTDHIRTLVTTGEEANILKSPYKDIVLPNLTIPEYLWQNLHKWADKTAVVCGVTGRGYTFSQAFRLSNTFAANLRNKLHLQDGHHVAVMLPNLPEYPLAALGIMQAGGIMSTINPIYTPHEIQRQLIISDAKIVITTAEKSEVIKEALKLAKLDIPIIVVKTSEGATPPGTILFSELAEDIHVNLDTLKEVRRKTDDIAILPYSSGTTGLPKGVELEHRNIIANCEQLDEEMIKTHLETTEPCGLSRDDGKRPDGMTLIPWSWSHGQALVWDATCVDTLAQSYLVSTAMKAGSAAGIAALAKPTHQDAVMGVLPFFHIYGMVVVMLHKLSRGCKLVTVPGFQPDTYLNAMIKNKISLIFAAPPLVLFMATHPEIGPKHYEHLRVLVSGAAPLPTADIARLFQKAQKEFFFMEGCGMTEVSSVICVSWREEKAYGTVGYLLPNTEIKLVDAEGKTLGPGQKEFNFMQGYGLTESSPVVCKSRREEKVYGTIGYPIPSTAVMMVDAEGNALGPDQPGEMLVRGPQVMRGYRNNPQANAEVFAPGRWLRTGDLASYNAKGQITISGRLKELIKVKGYQVPPAELEALLREHSDVADAAVVGAPHPVSGEVPRAFVVLRGSSTVQPKALLDYVAERVAPYKKIQYLQFIKAIPKNASGKIMRKELENMELP